MWLWGKNLTVGVSLLQKTGACLRLVLLQSKPGVLSFGTRAPMTTASPGKEVDAGEAGHFEEALGPALYLY